MKISAQDYEHISVITLSGEYTIDDVDQFNRTATERIEATARHVVVNCEHLEFIDSSGLESLLRLQERLGDKGGQLRLVQTDETIETILRLTRLDLALENHDSLEGAVRSLR